MSMISSLRTALRPAYRRLRVLLGAAPPPKKGKKEKTSSGKTGRTKAATPPTPAPAAVPKAAATTRAAGPVPAVAPKAAARKPAAGKAGAGKTGAGKTGKGKAGAGKSPTPGANRGGTPPAPVSDRRARRVRKQPEGAPWNILFLGGSNTVMSNGYVDALVACLADSRGPVGRVVNLSAGGNSTVHGLMLAKQRQDLADYDIVVIEYGVNDVKLAGHGAIEIWKAATEGLLRHLLTIRPDVHVVFVLFGRLDMRKGYMYRPAELTLAIAGAYAAHRQVTVVDIDHLFRNVLFPKAEEFAKLYSDGAHFRRPEIARLAGGLIASGVLGAPQGEQGPLPEPVFPFHFADSALVDLVGDPAQADRVFANSRYNIPTRRIGLGETVTFDLPGPIAGIEFVSLETGATLRVSEEGATPFALHTRHGRTGTAVYPFLLRCQALEDRPWPTLARGPRRVTLEALPDAPEGEVKRALKMVPAALGRAEAVYVTRLLCVP